MAPTLGSATRRNAVIRFTPFRLLALPPELRNMIYRHLLVKRTTISLDHNLSPSASCSQPHETKISPTLLYASKQLYPESSAILILRKHLLNPDCSLPDCFPIEGETLAPSPPLPINSSRSAYNASSQASRRLGIKMDETLS
ncbi:MAG: hypothetical protein M1835_004331 [Candelina submexicana]|nr:MAG: hypothetical protein M1835_004331 [Candelina submexicana]